MLLSNGFCFKYLFHLRKYEWIESFIFDYSSFVPVYFKMVRENTWIHPQSIRYYDQCKCEFVKWMKMCAIHVSGSRVPLNGFHFISSLLESWIWLQWCWDLWKFCWWWSGLFQFKEVTEAMVSNLLHAGEACLMNTDEGIHAMQSNSGFLISPVLRIYDLRRIQILWLYCFRKNYFHSSLLIRLVLAVKNWYCCRASYRWTCWCNWSHLVLKSLRLFFFF